MNLFSTAARGGALLLIAASAALGTAYAYQVGAHYGVLVGVAFGAMALGGELLKPVAVERAFSAGWRRPGQAVASVAVASVAICYSLAAELAFSAGARGDLAADRQAETAAARAARDTRERAEAELSSRIWPKQNVAELEDLQRKWQASGSGRPWNRTTDLVNARRKAELERVVAANAPGIERESDPQAAAVTTYLAAIGVQASPAAVATWLHLLPVLLLEIGSAFGLLVARGGERPATVARVVEAQPATVFQPALLGNREPQQSGQRVLEVLRAACRPLSNDELAGELGVAKGTASKWVALAGPAVSKVRVGRRVALTVAATEAVSGATVLRLDPRRRALGRMTRVA